MRATASELAWFGFRQHHFQIGQLALQRFFRRGLRLFPLRHGFDFGIKALQLAGDRCELFFKLFFTPLLVFVPFKQSRFFLVIELQLAVDVFLGDFEFVQTAFDFLLLGS